MQLVIYTPQDIPSNIFEQVVSVVEKYNQIPNANILIDGLERSEFIAVLVNNDSNTVVSTATLKNPRTSYKHDIFKAAGVSNMKEDYKKELGYIATHPDYEGKGYCKNLLKDFFSHFKGEKIFATTRNPIMIHILNRFGFKKIGDVYKNDLNLMVYDGCISR